MSVAIGLLLLSLLVFLHELGHFISARFCGVTVEAFSIGMGPVLVHKKIKETDYRISAFLIGGYCAMKGEQDLEIDFTKCEKDSFYGRPPIFRALIAFAGPLANFFVALILLSAVEFFPHPYFSSESEITIPENIDSAAKNAGMLSGDVIVRINDEKVEDFSDIPKLVSPLAGKNAKIEVNRNGSVLFFDVDIKSENGIGKLGVSNTKKMTHGSPFPLALFLGSKETCVFLKNYIEGIFSLFRAETKLSESLSGPVRITAELGGVAQFGFAPVLQFTAYISVALFVMNLLPLPALDGFLLIVSLLEAITKKRLSSRVRFIAQIVGISILVSLFLFSTMNDILYFFKGIR